MTQTKPLPGLPPRIGMKGEANVRSAASAILRLYNRRQFHLIIDSQFIFFVG